MEHVVACYLVEMREAGAHPSTRELEQAGRLIAHVLGFVLGLTALGEDRATGGFVVDRHAPAAQIEPTVVFRDGLAIGRCRKDCRQRGAPARVRAAVSRRVELYPWLGRTRRETREQQTGPERLRRRLLVHHHAHRDMTPSFARSWFHHRSASARGTRATLKPPSSGSCEPRLQPAIRVPTAMRLLWHRQLVSGSGRRMGNPHRTPRNKTENLLVAAVYRRGFRLLVRAANLFPAVPGYRFGRRHRG